MPVNYGKHASKVVMVLSNVHMLFGVILRDLQLIA